MLGICPIKWKQCPIVTIAVYWDDKKQRFMVLYSECDNVSGNLIISLMVMRQSTRRNKESWQLVYHLYTLTAGHRML